MRFATVAEAKNRLSEQDLDDLDWKRLSRERLVAAWENEPDALYDYL